MAKTYISLQTRWDQQKDRINDLTNLIGDISLLTTGDPIEGGNGGTSGDSDLVHAIIELDSDIGPRPYTNLTTTAKNLTEAINELDSDMGPRLNLPTSDNSSVVNAIIEIHDSIGEVSLRTQATTIKEAINELNDSIGSGGLNTTASTLIGSINEIHDSIGEVALSTQATTIKEAINELNDSIGSGGLNTTASTLIGALNEHESDIGNMTLTGLTATTLSAAARELRTELGDVTSLNTSVKTSAVAAINEIHDSIGETALTTNATTIKGAINELDEFQGGDTLTTTAQTISSALNELDALQGNVALPTTASTITGAINEHETDIGTVGNLNTTATDLVTAINEVKATADDAQAEIGGNMADDYDGDDTNIISALNNIFASASVSTLNAIYQRRDGVGAMNGTLDVAEHGIKSSDNAFIIATGSSDTTRLTISTNGNVGVGKSPSSYKFDVSGSVNASTLRYNGEDIDTRYLRAGGGGGGTTNITVPVDFQNTTTVTGDLEVTGDFEATGNFEATGDFTIGTELVFDADGYTFTEFSQDLVGDMFTGNSESGGISAIYNDSTGKITLNISDNAHDHLSSNISDFAEAVQDTVGAMVSGNSESGISVTYQDSDGTLDFNVNDPTITISGEASGSATMTNLGNVNIDVDISTSAVQSRQHLLRVYDVNGNQVFP